MTGPRSVAVLLGGPSAEHDVSLVSGRAVAAALAARGHAVEGWFIDLEGGWWRLPASALDVALPATAYDDPLRLAAEGPLAAATALTSLASTEAPPVVFIALHGPFGEDGTVQALCEAAGVIYTGSGVAASAVGMDKALFKRLVGGLGMPVVPWEDVTTAAWLDDPDAVQCRLVRFALDLPDPRLIIKPARLGSSVGISIVHRPADMSELRPAVEAALAHDDLVLAEAYLDHARELEVSVVGNTAADLEVYGPGEIFPGHEFYDYSAKYDAGVSRTTDRPEMPEQLRAEIHGIAARAYLAIGASGFARVDFLVGGGVLYLNEINTIPGFTPISLFPVLCREGGYDFGAIADRIVELAVARAARRPRRALTRADLP
ncbi:MAG TPA: D-alanine--D-alanine ligase [Candidatus Caenarcaniphilales bacterium]|nr:D-alanine--D-alanine ligase [Candidatus Caenarcaniphilales bacterium]